jgi:transposase
VQGCLFSQVQRVFIVENFLASRSYETYQNDFKDTFSDSFVTNKSTISRLVNRFHDTRSVQDRNRSGRPSVLSDDMLASLNAVDISNT